MKFYYISKLKHPHQIRLLSKYDIDSYDISTYNKNDIGILIISTLNIKESYTTEILSKYSEYSKLYFILNDSNEALPHKNRIEYKMFYEKLDECNIDRTRGIISYNNSYNIGITHHSDVNFNTIYFPTFLLEHSVVDESHINKFRKNKTKEYDFSFLVRNGKPHKKTAAMFLLENNYDVLLTYVLNRDFESNKISELDSDDFGYYLESSNYFKSKISIIAESEYMDTPDNPFNFKVNKSEYFTKIRHLTEKIWREIACGNPFVIIGNRNTLKHIRDIGFKTFDSLIDESYDYMDDDFRLYEALIQSKNLLKFYNTAELEYILEYNMELFKDNEFKKEKLHEFFINPLKKYTKSLV
jgi:hypothetical protein